MRLMSMLPVKACLSLGCLTLLLAGCTTAMPAEETPALGIPFNEQVKQGYVRLASAAYSEGDVPAAWHYRGKARAAMIGDTVWPDRVASHEVPEQLRPQALELRQRLVTVLQANGRVAAPEQAAAAQANFDCWLEELSDDPQSRAATACRDAFVAALEETESSLVPRQPFVVFFDRGTAELDDEARAVIARAAETIGTLDPTRIEVLGYADTYGSPSGNLQISQRRAETVANALIETGVPADLIDVQPRGEAEISPISAENRRAEIVVVQ
jgi:OOP family OmpA-OmpF porin